MASGFSSDRIYLQQRGQALLPRLIGAGLDLSSSSDLPESIDLGGYLGALVRVISQDADQAPTAILQGVKGRWRTLASTTEQVDWPIELVADALDSESVRVTDGWSICPLHSDLAGGAGQLLIQKAESKPEEFESVGGAVEMAIASFQSTSRQARRAQRLEAILSVTGHWNETRETDQLLTQIAETSTRLLGAERATIFLPDTKTGQLIGKPALGVENGELRIPAGAGVVGAVMESGETQRVDHDIATEQAQINREVDEQLGFETRSLICVPMINSKGKIVGAFELINKLEGNFDDADEHDLKELASHAVVAIDATKHVEKLVTSRKHVADQAADNVQMIGQCEQIKQLKSTLERVAATDLVVLITGENGTGKEVVAQMIHYMSDRRDQILVAVNCAAITESLLESELFGHEKGAFTDAHESRAGKFELADGGTLFLDEIGDMTLGGQAKLLRVLEEKIVVRVGGSTSIPTNARVVAATNQNLPELVGDKKFREDLFFRLNVLTIEIPPLRDRGDDIILLAEHFLDQFCIKARRNRIAFSASAKKRLLSHAWPGNVRELRNMMERLAYLSQTDKVDADDLAFIISPHKPDSDSIDFDQPLTEATKEFQRRYIGQQIDRAGGNMTDAASRMGLHRSNLYRKMRQLDMDADEE